MFACRSWVSVKKITTIIIIIIIIVTIIIISMCYKCITTTQLTTSNKIRHVKANEKTDRNHVSNIIILRFPFSVKHFRKLSSA